MRVYAQDSQVPANSVIPTFPERFYNIFMAVHRRDELEMACIACDCRVLSSSFWPDV